MQFPAQGRDSRIFTLLQHPGAGGFVAVEANASISGGTAVAVTDSAPLKLPHTDKFTFILGSLLLAEKA